jgi:hypothetical protein
MPYSQPKPHPDPPKLWKLGFWILTIAVVLPVWLLKYLPLVDLPLHLARADVLHRYGSDPFLQQVYDLVIEPIPNVGIDLLMVGLQWLMPVDIAMKLLISIILLLFCTGIREIFRLFANNASWLQVLAPLVAYHTMFVYGFLNYELGLGLFFWTFSYWYRKSVSPSVPAWIVLAILSTLCYFTHLSSYAFLAVAIATIVTYELVAGSSLLRHRLKLGTAAALPLIFFLLFMGGSGTNSGFEFSDVRGKFTTLLMLVTSYDKVFDLILVIGLAVITLLAFIAARKRAVDLSALTLTAVFALLFAVCPSILFTSHLADARLVPVLYVFLLCGIHLQIERRLAIPLVAFVLVLFSVRSVLIVNKWSTLSEEMHRQLKVAEFFPPRSRVQPLYDEGVVLNKEERQFRHLLSYKMLDRDLVLANFIALPGQQPIVFNQQPRNVLLKRTAPLTNEQLDSLQIGNDYIWAYKLSAHDNSLLAARYPAVVRSTNVDIYQLH